MQAENQVHQRKRILENVLRRLSQDPGMMKKEEKRMAPFRSKRSATIHPLHHLLRKVNMVSQDLNHIAGMGRRSHLRGMHLRSNQGHNG